MTNEERLRWTAFIGASFLLHAMALAWLDFTGADIGRLPSKLTVLLKSESQGESTEIAKAPASASRSRDLFHRPPVPVAKTDPVNRVEEEPAPVEAATAPERVAARKETEPGPMHRPAEKIDNASPPPPVAAPEPVPLQEYVSGPADAAASAADVAAAAPPPAPTGSNASRAERQGRLLSLLHDAISREKRYPMLAVRQRREGTATVSFSLSPSGEMDAIGVDRSSGFSVLDTAAVSAVSRVAPFSPARLFLSDVTRFKVDVTFKLN